MCYIFICAALITLSPKAFWIIQIFSVEECSSLMQNLMQICCLTCSVILVQQPHSTHAHSTASTAPLTSTVKSSLFTHAHSSPLSLAARLRWCHSNRSCYINSGWTFSRQSLCVFVCVYTHIYLKINYRNKNKIFLLLLETLLSRLHLD